MYKKRIVAILVLIALFMIILVIKYSISPPQQSDLPFALNTISIKDETYQNSDLGISFRYPANLFIVETPSQVTVTNIPPSDPRRQSDAMMGFLRILTVEEKTLKEVLEKLKEETLSSREVSIAGHAAIELTSTPDHFAGSTWINILVETKKGIIRINYMKDTEYERIYESIIESIKIS